MGGSANDARLAKPVAAKEGAVVTLRHANGASDVPREVVELSLEEAREVVELSLEEAREVVDLSVEDTTLRLTLADVPRDFVDLSLEEAREVVDLSVEDTTLRLTLAPHGGRILVRDAPRFLEKPQAVVKYVESRSVLHFHLVHRDDGAHVLRAYPATRRDEVRDATVGW